MDPPLNAHTNRTQKYGGVKSLRGKVSSNRIQELVDICLPWRSHVQLHSSSQHCPANHDLRSAGAKSKNHDLRLTPLPPLFGCPGPSLLLLRTVFLNKIEHLAFAPGPAFWIFQVKKNYVPLIETCFPHFQNGAIIPTSQGYFVGTWVPGVTR